MNKPTKFSSLGVRWGGRVSLLPRVAVSRNLLTSILLLVLMLWIVFPAVAQDSNTPVAASGSTVDTSIVIAMMAVFALIALGGTALVAYLSRQLGDSVKADKLQEFMDSFQKWAWQQAQMAAARTPQTWDDGMVNAGAAIFGYNPAVGTPSRPPRTLPPAPPVNPSTQPIPRLPEEPHDEQPIGKPLNELWDVRKTTFTEVSPPKPKAGEKDESHRRIAVPTGYAYWADGGDTKAHTDGFYDPDLGFKMNLDSRGRETASGNPACYGYETLETFYFAAGNRYTLSAHFDAKLSGGAVNIRAALLKGNAVEAELHPHRIDPGVYEDKSVVWVFEPKEDRALRVRVYVETEWATLHSESYVRWKMFPLQRQELGWGENAVVRF